MNMSEIEKNVITKVLESCLAAGYDLHSVYDGGENIDVCAIDAALEVIDSVGESTIWLYKGIMAGIYVVLGNDTDVIADHTDTPEFTAAVDAALKALDII